MVLRRYHIGRRGRHARRAFLDPDKNRPFEYRGFGLRRYIDDLRADTDFAALLDIGGVAQTLFRDYVVGVDETAPFSPVRYNASKIDSTSGVVLANQIELGKFSLRQVLDTLAQMASARWGVDGEDRKSTRLNSSHLKLSRMPSSA